MKIETPAGGHLEIYRDDLNVFEESPSAIVLTLRGEWKDELQIEAGPTIIEIEGKLRGETLLAFPMDAARVLHDELGRLIEESPA